MANYDEQKISLTLSNEAYQIINTDMSIFWLNDNLTGFINTIVENFKNESSASIKLAMQKERERLVKNLHPEDDHSQLSEQESEVINKLVSSFANELKKKMTSFPIGSETKKIRINNENIDCIVPFRCNGNSDSKIESEYVNKNDYKNAGRFIKAILEDYARQSLNRREEIIFAKQINAIKEGIPEDEKDKKRNIIKIKYRNRDNKISSFKIKPYKLLVDKQTGYQYCVGTLYNAESKKQINLSLRIYRIIKAGKMSLRSIIKSTEETNLIEEMASKGLAYMQGKKELCRIELTPQGENKYKSILHLRPKHINPDFEIGNSGNKIYEFDCTYEQIRNYFFRFGKEAIILTPESLMEEFLEKYKDAAQSYEERLRQL